MGKLRIFMAACAFLGASAMWAQTDVTSTYIQNADFSQGTPITVGVCTYAKDMGGNGTEYSQLVPVDGWDFGVENGDARAGGLVAFGSGVWIGGPGYTAPATNSDGDAVGNILGLVGVWTGTAQYVQDATLPAGTYTLVLGVYNSKGGTTAFVKNLIGFIEDGGEEHLAETTNYPVNTWKYEFITFTLGSTTSGKFSLGYQGSNVGSANAQHLFLSGIQLFEGEVDAEAYEKAKEDARNAKEVAMNKEKLAGSSSISPSEDLLINGSFDTANQGWALTNMGYQNNKERPTRYVEKWTGAIKDEEPNSLGAEGINGSATQTVKNMPAGVYVLNGVVNAQYQSDLDEEIGGVTLSVNDETVNPSGPWSEYEIVYEHQTDGDITVTFSFEDTNANWVSVDQFSLVYVGDSFDADAFHASKYTKDWEKAHADAEEAIDNEAYINVTGQERSNLQAEIAKSMPISVEGIQAAIENLNTATNEFTAAKNSYDALVAAKDALSQVYDLPYALSSKKPKASSITANTADQAASAAESLYSSIRAYYESNAMAENVKGAEDVTDFILNPNAENGNDDWTWEGNKNNPRNNESWTDSEGGNQHMYFDGGNWGATGWTTTMSQDIELPAGRYLLTAKGRASTDATLTLSVGENSVELPNIGASGNVFDRGWGDGSVEFETDGDIVTILVTATTEAQYQWFSVSDFRLVLLQAISVPMADNNDYSALAQAISAAEAYTLGFDAGEYAPYNNVEALQALAAAKAIDTESENTKDKVNNAILDLNAATWTANATDLENAIYDGTLADAPIQATSENVVLPGWLTESGNTRQTFRGTDEETGKAALEDAIDETGLFVHPGTYTYGTKPGYTMPLKAGVAYVAEAKFCAWQQDSNNDFGLILKKDGEALKTRYYGANKVSCTESGALRTVRMSFVPDEDGDFVLSVIANGNTFMTDFFVKKAALESVEVTSAGYATLVNDLDLDFSNTTIKAFTAYVEDGQVVLTPIDRVAGGTPVVLYCEGGMTEDVPVAAETDDATGNQLVAGTDTEVATDGGNGITNYILNDGSEGIGFYRANDQFVARAHAYLPVQGDNGDEARLAIVFSDVPTAVQSVVALPQPTQVYDLQGRKVTTTNLHKGLYIVNGKKVTVK